MSVHQRIREFRKQKGWTEQQMADACGVSRGSIRLWEQDGGTAPNRKRQPDVARVLGITIAELMSEGTAFVGTAADQLLARYEQADASVQAEVDELTSLPPEEAIKLAAIIKSIRATYAPKT